MAQTANTQGPAKQNRLSWKYCECGCKGHIASIGSFLVWLDSPGSPHEPQVFEPRTGHGRGAGSSLGRFNSLDDADGAAKAYLKPKYYELKRIVEEFGHLFV